MGLRIGPSKSNQLQDILRQPRFHERFYSCYKFTNAGRELFYCIEPLVANSVVFFAFGKFAKKWFSDYTMYFCEYKYTAREHTMTKTKSDKATIKIPAIFKGKYSEEETTQFIERFFNNIVTSQ